MSCRSGSGPTRPMDWFPWWRIRSRSTGNLPKRVETMKKMAAVTLATMLLLPPAAMADAAGDYAALVTAAKEGDPGTDYTAMRQAYLMLPEYDPFGAKTNDLIRDGQAAY